MRIRRKFYGWLAGPGRWRVGTQPPDSPVMPYTEFKSMDEAEDAVRARKGVIIWSGDAARHRDMSNASASAY